MVDPGSDYDFNNVDFTSVILRNIQPVNIDEEEKNKAFKLLFDSDKVYDSDHRDYISVLENDPNNRSIMLEKKPSNKTFSINYNTYTIEMQKKAIEKLENLQIEHKNPFLNLFIKKNYINWDTPKKEKIEEYFVLTDSNRSGSKQQREFVSIAMST